MDQTYDFTDDKKYIRPFGGTDRKTGIYHNGIPYMIKFTETHAKKTDTSTSQLNSVTSEYISSHICETTGLPVHKTLLGTYQGEAVVACQDFRAPDEENMEFGDFVLRHYTHGEVGRILRLDQIYETINTEIPEFLRKPSIDRYWNTFVVDALVGNFDRHKGNWGYLRKIDGTLSTAPIYDFGSTLLPQISDEGILKHWNVNDMLKRCLVYPSPALFIGTQKSGKTGYYDLLSSGYDENCTKALLKIYPRIDMNEINSIIDDTPMLSDTKREFFKQYVSLRKEIILDRAYERCSSRNYDHDALERIKSGNQYDVNMLEKDISRLTSCLTNKYGPAASEYYRPHNSGQDTDDITDTLHQ